LSGVVHAWISTNQGSGRRATMSNMPAYVLSSAVISTCERNGETPVSPTKKIGIGELFILFLVRVPCAEEAIIETGSMPPRRSGRSQSIVPPQKRKKGPSRKETAYSRAVDLLGEETVNQIGEQWATWDTGVGGKEWQHSEGVGLQLLQQGLSERVIRAIIPRPTQKREIPLFPL
jgi:hypothetical protein